MLAWFESQTLGAFPENDLIFACYPFYLILKICGLCPLRLQLRSSDSKVFFVSSKLWLTYTVLLLIFILTGFTFAIVSLSNGFGPNTFSSLPICSAWGQIIIVFVMAFLAVVTAILKRIEISEFLHRIREIDCVLEKFGTKISYRSQRIYRFLQLICLSVGPLIFSELSCLLLTQTHNRFKLCYWFMCLTPLTIIAMKDFQFYNMMSMLNAKVRQLNFLLSESNEFLLKNESTVNDDNVDAMVEVPEKRIDLSGKQKFGLFLREMAKVYLHIADLSKSVESVFAIHLFLTISSALIVVIAQAYNIFDLLTQHPSNMESRIFAASCWTLVQILVMIVFVNICSNTSKLMAETGPILHNIQSLSEDRTLFQIAQMFSLQILHRHVNFTAAGFFDLDYKLITSIVAAVTTYLVIIIQFHSQPKNDFFFNSTNV